MVKYALSFVQGSAAINKRYKHTRYYDVKRNLTDY